jgi:phospholipid/cholesterol/gamma-HCH transport system substrate-binding protein
LPVPRRLHGLRRQGPYNGVEIGRVGMPEAFSVSGQPKAKITLDVDPKYMKLIPQNVDANINATTVFGNKYISF